MIRLAGGRGGEGNIRCLLLLPSATGAYDMPVSGPNTGTCVSKYAGTAVQRYQESTSAGNLNSIEGYVACRNILRPKPSCTFAKISTLCAGCTINSAITYVGEITVVCVVYVCFHGFC